MGLERGEDGRHVRRRQPPRDHLPPGAHAPLRRTVHRGDPLALPDHHPVSLLLRPHFEGTIFINWSAIHFLVSDGGGVDLIQAGTIASDLRSRPSHSPARHSTKPWSPRLRRPRIRRRSAVRLPYRDDTLALWDAIRDWVASISIFYRDNGAVQSDDALQGWSGSSAPRTAVASPRSPSCSRSTTLVDTLSAIIYAASALHTAGNFPQTDITAYTPLAPGAGYMPMEQVIAVADEAQWLDMLPPLDMAALQLRLNYTLGSVHYTQLGRYELPGSFRRPQRRDPGTSRLVSSRARDHRSGDQRRNARLPARVPVPVPPAVAGSAEHQHLILIRDEHRGALTDDD